MYYYSTIGTETAAGPVIAVKVETTYITVNWTKPKYNPIKIKLDYEQSLLCEEKPYFTRLYYLPPDCNGMNFTMMKPGSACKITTFAVLYNPSELDRGLSYTFETLPSRKALTF